MSTSIDELSLRLVGRGVRVEERTRDYESTTYYLVFNGHFNSLGKPDEPHQASSDFPVELPLTKGQYDSIKDYLSTHSSTSTDIIADVRDFDPIPK